MATSNLYKAEENLTSENIISTRESYYMNNIFKNKLEILMTLENKEIRIHNIIINSKIQMGLEDFNKCKGHFEKNKESKENKIFEFLDYFKQRLIEDFKKNFRLILGLIIEKKGDSNYSCGFKFIPPSFPKDKILYFKVKILT